MGLKKKESSILGGASLRDKLAVARNELNTLQVEDTEQIEQEIPLIKDEEILTTKFHLTGRCNRKAHKYVTKAFYILENLDVDIKKYCNGGDVALFNYLIHLGLNEVKKREGHSFDEVYIMEDSYNVT